MSDKEEQGLIKNEWEDIKEYCPSYQGKFVVVHEEVMAITTEYVFKKISTKGFLNEKQQKVQFNAVPKRNMPAAALLSYLSFWSQVKLATNSRDYKKAISRKEKRKNDNKILKNRLVYKTYEELQRDIGIAPSCIQRAREILKSKGLIEEHFIGIPPKPHYLINHEKIDELLKIYRENSSALYKKIILETAESQELPIHDVIIESEDGAKVTLGCDEDFFNNLKPKLNKRNKKARSSSLDSKQPTIRPNSRVLFAPEIVEYYGTPKHDTIKKQGEVLVTSLVSDLQVPKCGTEDITINTNINIPENTAKNTTIDSFSERGNRVSERNSFHEIFADKNLTEQKNSNCKNSTLKNIVPEINLDVVATPVPEPQGFAQAVAPLAVIPLTVENQLEDLDSPVPAIDYSLPFDSRTEAFTREVLLKFFNVWESQDRIIGLTYRKIAFITDALQCIKKKYYTLEEYLAVLEMAYREMAEGRKWVTAGDFSLFVSFVIHQLGKPLKHVPDFLGDLRKEYTLFFKLISLNHIRSNNANYDGKEVRFAKIIAKNIEDGYFKFSDVEKIYNWASKNVYNAYESFSMFERYRQQYERVNIQKLKTRQYKYLIAEKTLDKSSKNENNAKELLKRLGRDGSVNNKLLK